MFSTYGRRPTTPIGGGHLRGRHLWAGIDDAGQRVPATWFESITSWATDAIERGGVVLTHCHMGINRGPSAGYAVLLRLGWDPVEALAAIRAARPIANVWYAEDALEWHLARSGAVAGDRERTLARVATWRRENPLDVVRIIARSGSGRPPGRRGENCRRPLQCSGHSQSDSLGLTPNNAQRIIHSMQCGMA